MTDKKRKPGLAELIFAAICCDIGIVAKKLIAPLSNVITGALHIPGGISTSFSIMFVVIGAAVCGVPGSATLMCVLQSVIALAMGSVGSMGMLSVVGYVVPGIAVDICFFLLKRSGAGPGVRIAAANAVAGFAAALTVNAIVFHLRGWLLCLYLGVAMISGLAFGLLGALVYKRVSRALNAAGKTKQ